MLRFRYGKLWKVGVVTRDFRAPAPESINVVKGAKVLFRVNDHEVIFPGDSRIHVVRDTHGLLTHLVKPAWPWRVPAPSQQPHGVAPNGQHLVHLNQYGTGLGWDAWADMARKNPDKIEESLGKDPGWVKKLLAEDPETMKYDPMSDFEYSPAGSMSRVGFQTQIPFSPALVKEEA